MRQEIFNGCSIILQSLTALSAATFAIWQIKINERLKKLEDYVALSAIPNVTSQGNYEVRFHNVGKINLYLHKYEIGTVTFNYTKPRLLPAKTEGMFFSLPILNYTVGQETEFKLYLTDEFGLKYLSTGGLIINPIQTIMQNQQTQVVPAVTPPTMVTVPGGIRAWSYKTVKFKWEV
jgi:hypothetical protein